MSNKKDEDISFWDIPVWEWPVLFVLCIMFLPTVVFLWLRLDTWVFDDDTDIDKDITDVLWRLIAFNCAGWLIFMAALIAAYSGVNYVIV